MSNRNTDTDKWKDDWFLMIGNDYRIIYLWLLDNCNIAGIWKKQFAYMNKMCNTNVSQDEFDKVFTGRCIDIGDAYFIPKFLKHQYPNGLGSMRPIVIGVRKEIEKYNLMDIITQSLGNDYPIIANDSLIISNDIKVKGKEKQSKEIEIGEECEERKEFLLATGFIPPTREDVLSYCQEKGYIGFDVDKFINFYESNGWKVGKNKMKKWRNAVGNAKDWCMNRNTNLEQKLGKTASRGVEAAMKFIQEGEAHVIS